MVLVHGGGGTAFSDWVKLWNSRGYAAISMDTCGQIPKGTYGKWERHEAGGPAGWNVAEPADRAPHDQWPYQAVGDVMLAHSLLRAMPEVDADRIGLTGISWGGYLTCIVAGSDDRFKLAVPVYGCGFLGENSTWLNDFKNLPDGGKAWLSRWDPSVYLPNAKMPMLWVTGTNDFAYPMDSLQKSYHLPKGPRTICLKVRMPHGHGGAGENPEEIHAFVDSILRDGKKLAVVKEQGRQNDEAFATFESEAPIVKAELTFTKDEGVWQKRNWETAPAEVSAPDHKVTAKIPAGTKVYYLNLIDDRGLYVSTEHVVVP
jgi:dienelactone hydrolase